MTPPVRRELRESAAGALLVAVAALAFRRVFTTADVARALPAAVLLPTLGVLLARRAGLATAALAGLAGAVVAVVVAALLATPEPGGPGALDGAARAVAGGWRRVLTSALPVAGTPDRLPVVAVATGVAAAATALLVGSARTAAAPLLPGLLLVPVGVLLGVGGPVGPVALALPVALAGLLLLALRALPVVDDAGAAPGAPAGAAGAVAGGTAALVVAGLVAAAVGVHLPGHGERPRDPRRSVQPPLAVPAVADPLSQLGPRLRTPQRPLFTAVVPPALAAAGGRRDWRQLTLDTYDGLAWTASSRAVAVGTTLPPAPGQRADVRLTVQGLDGLWVPTPGPVVGLGRPGLGYDATAGSLVDPAGLRPGSSYSLTSAVSSPTAAQLQGADVGSATAGPQLTAVPACTPAPLLELASTTAAPLARPDEKAAALEQALATGGGFAVSADSDAGHSCGRLAQLFTRPDHAGTSEQFATAYVLMARSVGLPARLAVGFRPGDVQPDGRTVQVLAGDATAWPEVLLGDLGWVAFDPTPTRGAAPRAPCSPPNS